VLQRNNLHDQNRNSVVRSWWFTAFQFLVLLFFSMFDFYKSGVRIFDIAAFVLIIIFSLIFFNRKSLQPIPLISLSVAGIYASFGLLSSENYPTVFALFINCFLFYLLSHKEFKPSQNQITMVLLIHLVFFFLQLLYFYAVGDVVNYHHFTDIDPRLESSIFRPAGLFYEPAIYCYAVFILTTMLDPKKSKYGFPEAVVMVSMVLSVSLLGFFFAFFILIRLVFNKKYIAPILCFLPIIFVSKEQIEMIFIFIESRVLDLGSDASAEGRYGDFSDLFSSENLIFHLVGRGFGASFEQFGSSGASAGITAVGVVGVVLFAGGLFFKSRELLIGILSLIAIMISAPIFSYGIFPYWIANIICQGNRSRNALSGQNIKKSMHEDVGQ
jgi:hypothetical protein